MHYGYTIIMITVYFSMLDKNIPKSNSKILFYRDYKKFDEKCFESNLKLKLNHQTNDCYNDFKKTFVEILDQNAPMKKKILRHNQSPFMSKHLRKAIMTRSRLKNIYNKKRTFENLENYKKQRNFCVNLLKREKRKYYNNLNLNIFKDNKTFCKRIKPLFSDKYRPANKGFILIDNNENISESKDIAESLNDFFIKSVDNLDIEPFIQSMLENNSERSVLEIIKEYESHPSIKRIKAHFHVKEIFKFREISTEDLKTKLAIDTKKASVPNDIPSKVLVSSNEIVSEYLSEIYE